MMRNVPTASTSPVKCSDGIMSINIDCIIFFNNMYEILLEDDAKLIKNSELWG